MVEEGNIIERNWKLNVSGMSGTGKSVLTTCGTSVDGEKKLSLEIVN
jgi:hypothetical protein